MRKFVVLVLLFIFGNAFSQEVLTLEEYLGYVKKYHPIIKQAQLITSVGEAKLLKSRGAFDPKIEVDYQKKEFKSKEYYDRFNGSFKVPTWYGIEFKANYEKNSGMYLNPEMKTPKEGLYSAGISVSLAKGLLINERMATLKQAKLYEKQSAEKQKLVINKILFNAVEVYLNWLKNYQAKKVYSNYLKNAETRLKNVKTSFFAGDKPAVDTLEANINFKTRRLDFEKTNLVYLKSKLATANYLWLDNNVPLEMSESLIPDETTITKMDMILKNSIADALNFNADEHPKLKQLELKKQSLIINRRLKLNNLLPKIDLQYNFLSSDYQSFNSFNTNNYKGFLSISMPIFVRKERADLRLAKLKVNDIDFEISATKVELQNKVKTILAQLDSYKKQQEIAKNLVSDYDKLIYSEQRKFELGEGSLFLVNYREVKQIENNLKYIDSQYNFLSAKAKLLQALNGFY
ncbi:MAG: transporter [Flavobacteriales bacterium]|nr:MAG: transporter [Flavobacteriales bacterium]